VGARDFFAEAFKLDERNYEAREFYAALLFLTGEAAEAKALAYNEIALNRFAVNDFVINAVNQAKDFGFMIELYKARITQQPDNEQNWASLAFLYKQMGDKTSAVETLRKAGQQKPSFAKIANCIADNIAADREAEVGCQ
jgi:cytochrome c-type biogenesis protein CcmH/NrfG